jgi:uncharacterized membrane protein
VSPDVIFVFKFEKGNMYAGVNRMRINRKICWLPLLVVGLTTILSSCSVLAQAEKTDLILRVVSDNYYNRITAGQEETIFLEVGNLGNRELTNIRLSADAPKGWPIEFSPEFIDTLAPDSFQTVDVVLRPAEDAEEGEYNIALIAEANETRRVTSIYVSVESASLFWVWVGAGIAAVLIAGFVLIFMRFGRE